FTIAFGDAVAISQINLSAVVVQVTPTGGAPIIATAASTTVFEQNDGLGDAEAFIVTYQITPPGGAWSLADNGTYTVSIGGAPVTNLAGNSVALGNLGSFTVQLAPHQFVIVSQPSASLVAEVPFSISVLEVNDQGQVENSFNGNVSIALGN